MGQHCYKATSNGVIDEKDLDGIAKSIGGVYEHADFVGSLVLPEGDRRRPTSWQKMPREWFPWWVDALVAKCPRRAREMGSGSGGVRDQEASEARRHFRQQGRRLSLQL